MPLESVTTPPVTTVAGNVLIPSSPKTSAGSPVEASIRVTVTPSIGAPVFESKTTPYGSTSAAAAKVSVPSDGSV